MEFSGEGPPDGEACKTAAPRPPVLIITTSRGRARGVDLKRSAGLRPLQLKVSPLSFDVVGKEAATFEDREDSHLMFANAIDDSVRLDEHLAYVVSTLLAYDVTRGWKARRALGGSEQLVYPSRGRDRIISGDVVVDLLEIDKCTFSPDELAPAAC